MAPVDFDRFADGPMNTGPEVVEALRRLTSDYQALAYRRDFEDIDDLDEIGEAAQRARENVGRTADAVADLVNITRANLEFAMRAHEDAKRVERFSRRMGVASFMVAVASVIVAVVALTTGAGV